VSKVDELFLGLICVRGGSKGIPRKNLRTLGGKPLLVRAIESALASPTLDRVVVSTEDAEIAMVARQGGADVPFLRPPELSLDTTRGIDPVLHAVTWLEENERYLPDYVVLLQATSPFLLPGDIEGVARLAVASEAGSVISLSEVQQHPYSTYSLYDDGSVASFLGLDLQDLEKKFPRRQDLPAAYVENGAIHLTRRTALMRERTLYSPKTYGYIMPPERSLDIDTPLDLRLAEWLVSYNEPRE